MEVGHGIVVLMVQTAVEAFESCHSAIVAEVYTFDGNIGRHPLEERLHALACEDGDVCVGVGFSQGTHHGHGHRHIAQCRESDDKEFSYHFFP